MMCANANVAGRSKPPCHVLRSGLQQSPDSRLHCKISLFAASFSLALLAGGAKPDFFPTMPEKAVEPAILVQVHIALA
jgi:hypothetical protein